MTKGVKRTNAQKREQVKALLTKYPTMPRGRAARRLKVSPSTVTAVADEMGLERLSPGQPPKRVTAAKASRRNGLRELTRLTKEAGGYAKERETHVVEHPPVPLVRLDIERVRATYAHRCDWSDEIAQERGGDDAAFEVPTQPNGALTHGMTDA